MSVKSVVSGAAAWFPPSATEGPTRAQPAMRRAKAEVEFMVCPWLERRCIRAMIYD